jgi:hypothetical protein
MPRIKPPQQIVPLYTWAGDHATIRARLALLKPGDITILNPPNPAALTSDETQLIRLCQSEGMLVAGYLPYGYGNVSAGHLIDTVHAWRRAGVKRIFFDECPADLTSCAGFSMNALVWAGGTVKYQTVFNLGCPHSDPQWVPPPNCLAVTFEGPYSQLGSSPGLVRRSWEAAIAYSAPAALSTVWVPGWQWQSVTSGMFPNPYDDVQCGLVSVR